MKQKQQFLGDYINNRDNNLNLVKFIAALLVIVSHAYAFAIGYEKKDFYYNITGGNGDLGALAVYVFFFYSGLLVSRSLMGNGSLKRYIKRRTERIYPAFLAVMLSIVFLAGPIFTCLTLKEYFTAPDTYRYLRNLIFITEHNLPGVFGGNIYGTAVNGPIWTIRVEVFCYVICYLLYASGLLFKRNIGILVLVYIIAAGIMGAGIIAGIPGISAVIMPFTMFFIGMIYARYSERIKMNRVCNIISVICFILLSVFNQVIMASMVFLPYILCYAAFCTRVMLKRSIRLGECSYEIYLWGGFAGQAVTYMYGGIMNVYLNMVLTIIISVILGYVTHKMINVILYDK